MAGSPTAKAKIHQLTCTESASDPELGAGRAAAFYTLIETAKMNGLNPEGYLRDVLTRVAEHPAKRLADLLPWNWMPTGGAEQAA